jgi:serine phosphatase RsbU (regulator of sigma subunit)
MMIERKVYDLIERVSAAEQSGSFGLHLLDSLYAAFADDLGILSAELWQHSRSEGVRNEVRGAARSASPDVWMQVHFKRHKKLNPFWHFGNDADPPAAVITFGKKQRWFMTFHFKPLFFHANRRRVEETILLMTQLVTMFVQKHEEQSQLQEILSLSMRQQQRVLSPSCPPFPGFEIFGCSEASEEVGGDYYNVESLAPDVLAVTIADAKGKGFIAAVQVTALHRCLRLLRREPLKITAKMSRLNQAFVDDGDDRDPISAVLGELHQDGRFLYVNASHPYPLLRKGQRLDELTEGGLFIGLAPEAPYRFGMVNLEAGDLLCLYTDGVSESERGDCDHLPEMREILRSQSDPPLPEVARSILSLTGQPEYRDDRTLVLIRRLKE